ncbi:MAG: hypothetical protein HY315_08600, partial [Acidobacteria bacterium]|nr:hypothetical protein [Acidobacteriota bacterium]
QQTTAIFPQIADGIVGGLRFTAEIEIENLGTAPFAATVEFFGGNGQPLSFDLRLLSAGSPPQLASRFEFSVPPGAMRLLRGGTASYAARAGWCRITLGLPSRASATYRLEALAAKESAAGAVPTKHLASPLSQVTVLRASPFDRLVIPVVQDLGGARLGVAAANTATRPISGTGTVYNENGQVAGSFAIQIDPMGQFLKFLDEAVSLPVNFRGLVLITWADTSVQGWGSVVGLLLYPNGVLAAVPITRSGSSTGSATTTDAFPHTADGQIPGFEYVAQIILMNGDARDLDSRLEFFDDAGAPVAMNLEAVGVSPAQSGSTFQIRVPAKGIRVLRGGNSGGPARSAWVRLTRGSNFFAGQVDFIVLPRSGAGKVEGMPLTQVSVQSSSEADTAFMPVIHDTSGSMGFALANDSSGPIAAMAMVLDEEARTVGSFPISIPFQGRAIGFLEEKMRLPEHFRGLLRIVWPSFNRSASTVGLVLYPNGVLAAVP